MAKIDEWQERYNKWWKGKLVQLYEFETPKRVASIKLGGPPSFVYGFAEFIYEDGTRQLITTSSYKPRKSDVIVVKE